MNQAYLITNIINNKKYVGITCRGYEERWHEHVLNAQTGIQTILGNAIRKYGQENFKLTLLEDDIPDELAASREQYYISSYNSFYDSGEGYNMTRGGGGVVGYKHTDETKAKISNSLKGHVFPESRNKKISDALKKVEKTFEWRSAISKARKGKYTEDSNGFYGKHHSQDTKKKISDANSGPRVFQIDSTSKAIIRIHKNLNSAGRWVVENGFSKGRPETCALRIGEICNQYKDLKHKAYSFNWMYEEGQSTN